MGVDRAYYLSRVPMVPAAYTLAFACHLDSPSIWARRLKICEAARFSRISGQRRVTVNRLIALQTARGAADNSGSENMAAAAKNW